MGWCFSPTNWGWRASIFTYTTIIPSSLPLPQVNRSRTQFRSLTIIPNMQSFPQASGHIRWFLNSFNPIRVHPSYSPFTDSQNSCFSVFTNSASTPYIPPVLEHDPPNSPQYPPLFFSLRSTTTHMWPRKHLNLGHLQRIQSSNDLKHLNAR